MKKVKKVTYIQVSYLYLSETYSCVPGFRAAFVHYAYKMNVTPLFLFRQNNRTHFIFEISSFRLLSLNNCDVSCAF